MPTNSDTPAPLINRGFDTSHAFDTASTMQVNLNFYSGFFFAKTGSMGGISSDFGLVWVGVGCISVYGVGHISSMTYHSV